MKAASCWPSSVRASRLVLPCRTKRIVRPAVTTTAESAAPPSSLDDDAAPPPATSNFPSPFLRMKYSLSQEKPLHWTLQTYSRVAGESSALVKRRQKGRRAHNKRWRRRPTRQIGPDDREAASRSHLDIGARPSVLALVGQARLDRRIKVVRQIRGADVKGRSDEGHHAMNTSGTHRTVQKAAQSPQIRP